MSSTARTRTADPILLHLQQVNPLIESYQTTKHIVQGSAEGFIVQATCKRTLKHENVNILSANVPPPPDQTQGQEESLKQPLQPLQQEDYFVKYVNVPTYKHKAWADLRRTIHYTRTEVRFYNEILPLLKQRVIQQHHGDDDGDDNWTICPKVYLAEYNLKDLMSEDESTEATTTTSKVTDPQYTNEDTSILEGRYGVLVMDNAQVNGCYQEAPLRLNMAYQSVDALAKFHAASFQQDTILNQVSQRLCQYGGSYHLKNRNPKELEWMVQAWDDFLTNIMCPHVPEGLLHEQDMQHLGERIVNAAEYISNELSPLPNDRYATIVHGDYKAMNIFFQDDKTTTTTTTHRTDNHTTSSSTTPLLIDFASTGVGLGMSDLAMHIAQIALAEDLDNHDIEAKLVEHYYDCLIRSLPKDVQNVYSKDEAWRHFRFATVDYFRFILGRQWKGVTMEVFAKRNKNTNFAMVNRSIDAAFRFAKRSELYLREIEQEMEERSKLKNEF
jgi:hypothetical protein